MIMDVFFNYWAKVTLFPQPHIIFHIFLLTPAARQARIKINWLKSIVAPPKKRCVKISANCCICAANGVPLRCHSDNTFFENCPHQSRSGYSSNFYEMPRKALRVMAGLDRKVLNSRRITKRVAPSNPVFSRSFITSFGVASYRQGVEHVLVTRRVPLLIYS